MLRAAARQRRADSGASPAEQAIGADKGTARKLDGELQRVRAQGNDYLEREVSSLRASNGYDIHGRLRMAEGIIRAQDERTCGDLSSNTTNRNYQYNYLNNSLSILRR